MDNKELKPCPYCKGAWVHAGEYDYGSDYNAYGYTITCKCGYAWRNRKCHDTREAAINDWNSRFKTTD